MLPAISLLVLPATALGATDEERFREAGSSYVEQVHEALHARWKTFTEMLLTMPPGTRFRDDKELSVTLELKVWPDGTVVRVEHTSASGLSGFDSAPVELVRDLARLPPPPPGLRSDDGQVYLRWRFDRAGEDADRGAVIERRLPIEDAVERLVGVGAADRAAQRVDEEISAAPARAPELLWRLARAVVRRDVTSSEPARRAVAARALAVLDDNEGALLALARDPDAAVRAAAYDAIGHTEPTAPLTGALMAALDGPDAASAARAIGQQCQDASRAARCRDEGAGSLRMAVRRLLASGRVPAEAAAALAAMGDGATARSMTATLLTVASTRAAGARAALQLAAPPLEDALVTALAAAKGEEKALLVEALGALGRNLSTAGRGAATRALGDGDAVVRAAAARAVGAAFERKAKSRLIDVLADESAPVRAAATAALVAIAPDDASDELFRPLRDSAASVRAALAAALVAHPSDLTTPLLRRLRTDPDPLVQRAARGAAPAVAVAASSVTSGGEDSDARLLRAPSDAERARAAADWLCLHARKPAATAQADADAVRLLAVVY